MMTSLTPFSSLRKRLPLKVTRGFILRPLAITARHTVMRCFSCPIVNSAMTRHKLCGHDRPQLATSTASSDLTRDEQGPVCSLSASLA